MHSGPLSNAWLRPPPPPPPLSITQPKTLFVMVCTQQVSCSSLWTTIIANEDNRGSSSGGCNNNDKDNRSQKDEIYSHTKTTKWLPNCCIVFSFDTTAAAVAADVDTDRKFFVSFQIYCLKDDKTNTS